MLALSMQTLREVCVLSRRRGGRQDTRECFLKAHGSPDSVTKPSDAFYGGLNAKAPIPPPTAPPDEAAWCATVSWPFGGACEPGCPCPARVIIGKGLGWEIGWQVRARTS